MEVRKQNLQLENFSISCPISLPCHAFALGIWQDYCIGDLIGTMVDSHVPDFELLEILEKELQLFDLSLTEVDYEDISNLCTANRVILITRMMTPCRDYHFYLFLPTGKVAHKLRNFLPTVSNRPELVRGEYVLGSYMVKRIQA
ncbi:MAG TPA: hypothetical protein IAB70_01685 [Candidatus Merdicola faecigallinarum]|uniref:Uncharacterized protein n=1 Tax=Candidatus Merdicola faecigallinarum TaxID=2840862 RepID=A0A9D1M018_9FIRM|nr:hypothetical protein [Candidatus Merdicola faecigallinarum]